MLELYRLVLRGISWILDSTPLDPGRIKDVADRLKTLVMMMSMKSVEMAEVEFLKYVVNELLNCSTKAEIQKLGFEVNMRMNS